jgi:hypothetical protein
VQLQEEITSKNASGQGHLLLKRVRVQLNEPTLEILPHTVVIVLKFPKSLADFGHAASSI